MSRVLALDTTGPFTSITSWHARDAGATDGLATKGYIGAAFDGRSLCTSARERCVKSRRTRDGSELERARIRQRSLEIEAVAPEA